MERAPTLPARTAYLDTNVVILMAEALNGSWRPPETPDDVDEQRLAAARLFLYSGRSRNPHFDLVTSSASRRELLREPGASWLATHLVEIDDFADAPAPSKIRVEIDRLRSFEITDEDAVHVAEAVTRPWVTLFVTEDRKLVSRSQRAVSADHLGVVTSHTAVQLLQIQPGEQPPIEPSASSPLAGESWWVPR